MRKIGTKGLPNEPGRTACANQDWGMAYRRMIAQEPAPLNPLAALMPHEVTGAIVLLLIAAFGSLGWILSLFV